jgi:hypothetical protein
LKFTDPFMTSNSNLPMMQPGMDKTGPVPVHPPSPTMPLEQLIIEQQKQQQVGGPAPSVVNSPPPMMPPAAGMGTAPASMPTPGGGK